LLRGLRRLGRSSLVVSYEGLYIDIANEGEEIVARGKVEKVYDTKSSETYYQLTVGSFEAQGKDFIKPVEWLKGFG
jgi:predicted nucleotidyltransferase